MSIKQSTHHFTQAKHQNQELSPARKLKTFKNRSDVYKAKDELLKARSLYQDELFPPTELADVAWLRPTDLSLNPSLTVDPMLLDLQSDTEGNGGLVAAFASICWRKELVARLCPDRQSFSHNYCGLFYFQFWHFGEWVVVVIDDQLPYMPFKKKLLRLRSKREDEFFFGLLEKAYAKFVGGYEALAMKKVGDILVDLTGGISEMWVLAKNNSFDWFPAIEKLTKIQTPTLTNLLKFTEAGSDFDSRITYVLKDAVTIDLTDENRTVRLVKLQDPWGKLAKYTGDWNNEAHEWRKVPQLLREKLAAKNDGTAGAVYEFWMTFYDFMCIFTHVQFCVMSPKDMGPVAEGLRWDLTTIKGQFPRYIPTVSNIHQKDATVFEIYPQYLEELTDVDENLMDGKCELVVSLLQKSPQLGERWMTMGYSLFPIARSKDRPPMAQDFFSNTKEAARSRISSSREIVSRFRLRPGRYVLVVVTTAEFKQREFMIRMYKHQRIKGIDHVIEHLDEMDPYRKCMIPPSSRLAPVGAYEGPTRREDNKKQPVQQWAWTK